MKVKKINENYEYLGEKTIELKGWIKNIRKNKKLIFIKFTDGSVLEPLQIVAKQDDVINFEELEKLTVGSSIMIKGDLKITEGREQPFEILAKRIDIINLADESYVIQPKKHSDEFLREQAHLRVRTQKYYSIFKIRSRLAKLIHDFFEEEDFTYIHTPILTGIDSEGAGEMFKVSTLEDKKDDYENDFFKKKAFLTVSGQLEAEALSFGFGNVYTFGPTFRAEKSNTKKHVAEFWMMEPEIAFANLNDLMNNSEELLKYVINGILKNSIEELEFLNKENEEIDIIERLKRISETEFKRLEYKEAIDILLNAQKSGVKFEFKVEYGIDLATEHERYLSEEIAEGPLFVTNYPKDIKAFYMKENEDGKTVAAIDMLIPGIGELIGGSVREDDKEKLEKRAAEMDVSSEAISWYFDLRKNGSVPHGGYGLGFERLIMYITGVDNIRDVSLFPRVQGNIKF